MYVYISVSTAVFVAVAAAAAVYDCVCMCLCLYMCLCLTGMLGYIDNIERVQCGVPCKSNLPGVYHVFQIILRPATKGKIKCVLTFCMQHVCSCI